MDLWYAHQGTTVYLLTELPDGSKRKVGYSDSGWTTCGESGRLERKENRIPAS